MASCIASMAILSMLAFQAVASFPSDRELIAFPDEAATFPSRATYLAAYYHMSVD